MTPLTCLRASSSQRQSNRRTNGQYRPTATARAAPRLLPIRRPGEQPLPAGKSRAGSRRTGGFQAPARTASSSMLRSRMLHPPRSAITPATVARTSKGTTPCLKYGSGFSCFRGDSAAPRLSAGFLNHYRFERYRCARCRTACLGVMPVEHRAGNIESSFRLSSAWLRWQGSEGSTFGALPAGP